METENQIHSSYLRSALGPKQLKDMLKLLRKGVTEKNLQFDAIACRGMSGALVVPILALRLDKGIIVCRKANEKSHGYAFEGHALGGNYIIVDDFIGTGETIQGILDAVVGFQKGYTGQYPTMQPYNPVGIFLYRRGPLTVPEYFRGTGIPIFGVLKP